MNLIKNIVDNVKSNDNVDARKNIIKLTKEIRNYKEKVKSYIDSNYKEFLPALLSNEQLLEEGSELETELSNNKEFLANETSAMYEANDEISKYVEELQEAQIKLKLSLKLLKIDKSMEKMREANDAKAYADVHVHLNRIQLMIDDPEDKIVRKLDIYQHLKLRLLFERKSLMVNLGNRFKSLVQMKEKSFPKTRVVTMSITKNLELLAESTNAILDSEFNFNDTAEFMMINIFKPVLSRAVSMKFSDNENDFSMTLSYSTEPVTDELRPNYMTVFTNLSHLLYFLMSMNFQLKNDEYLVPFIFHNRYDDLLRLIMDECLMHSIPNTFEEKSQCTLDKDITKLTEAFEKLYFKSEKEKLEDYPAQIDRIFYSHFVKNIVNKASEILKRDLHDTIAISEDTTLATTTALTFPRSMISKSTLELIRLLEKVIAEAKKCDDESAEKREYLMDSVRAVLRDYPFSIQIHHSRLMSQIPQQSALFYNNCMYLSNWALNNRDTEGWNIEFVTKSLEEHGLEILEVQISKQEIQLLDCLNQFDPSQALNVINPEVFNPIRQCLRQMDLLKNVWQTILPSNLYNKTIAGLLNVISLNFVNKVAAMEDISATLSNAFVDLIKTIDEKSQALFEPDISVMQIVDGWQRLMHLQFILDGTLIEISQSWKSEQLSKSFAAEDVKRLIRALFQNTDRRSTALSMII